MKIDSREERRYRYPPSAIQQEAVTVPSSVKDVEKRKS
jgi:hypothetical protein